MSRSAATASLWFAIAFVATAISARAASPCSTDTFTIDSSAVTVQLCLATAAHHATGAQPTASLDETFSTKGQAPLTRTLALDTAPSEEPSRTIDDVPLQKLGIARTLHLTIAIRTSSVRLEHALLVPGAVTLK